MSNRPKLFDNEMDEKTVERISNNFPVLTDEEKDRIFSFIEKEFGEDTETIEHDDFDDEVSGVERCIRPRWLEVLGTAAMIAIVVGSVGGGSYFMNHINKNAPKENSQEATTSVTTTVSSEYSVSTGTKPSVTTYTNPNVEATTTSAIVVTVPVAVEVYESEMMAKQLAMTDDTGQKTDVIPMFNEVEPVITTTVTEPETLVTTTVTSAEFVQEQEIVTGVNKDNVSEEINQEDELASIAESLIDKYDTLTLMRVARLPFEEDSETVTFIHGPGAYSSRAYDIQFKKVDKTVFANMKEMKDFYDSVMYRTLQEDERLFGPEISKEEYEEGYLFYGNDPNYFFLSIDGELYECIIGDMTINVHSDIPVVLSNISEYRFQTKKMYHKLDDVSSTIELTFSFVKDFNTGIWRIFGVSYNGQ